MTRQAYEKWLPAATALTHVRDSFSTPMHVTLSETAALARQEVENLRGLGDFCPSLIEEAHLLSGKLRKQRSLHTVPHHARRALDLRRRMATLLLERIMRVRAAARFVFRNHPEIARQASSSYGHRRRAVSRQASARSRAQSRGASLATDAPNPQERALSKHP